MLTKFRSVFVVLSLLLPSALLADGLIFQLPPDGTWARFEYDGTGGGPDGKVDTTKGTMTVSSVGVVQVDGEACRWIELFSELKRGDQPITGIHKLLIPEKSLGKGEDPLPHVHKAWHNHSLVPGRVPEEIRDLKGKDAVHLRFLRRFLHGTIKNTEPLPTVVVESKLGKLECAGHMAQEKTDQPGISVIDSTYIIRLHPSAPFGVVAYETTVKVLRGGKESIQMSGKMKLVDFGKDAKSQLPDSK